jgi:hypothetical protein
MEEQPPRKIKVEWVITPIIPSPFACITITNDYKCPQYEEEDPLVKGDSGFMKFIRCFFTGRIS